MEKECDIFSRYLVGREPDAYIRGKYAAAFEAEGVLVSEAPLYIDSLLLKLAILHPFFTHIADIYSRFFRSGSIVRKRLVFLLALLESYGPTADILDKPGKGGKLMFITGMIFRSLFMVITLLITFVMFFPIQYFNEKIQNRP